MDGSLQVFELTAHEAETRVLGHRIECLRLVRERTGCTLAEALATERHWQDGRLARALLDALEVAQDVEDTTTMDVLSMLIHRLER